MSGLILLYCCMGDCRKKMSSIPCETLKEGMREEKGFLYPTRTLILTLRGTMASLSWHEPCLSSSWHSHDELYGFTIYKK